MGDSYRVHGMMQSYFTRKMTGYLDYKRIPWLFRRIAGVSPEALAAGWPGGIPPLQTPDGTFMWDSTAMIHHLELLHPEPSVSPTDSIQRFLSYVIEDVCDEWLYRPAVGSRWFYPENTAVGGFELARDITARMPVSCDIAHQMGGAHVRSSCGLLGVNDETIASWVDEVLRPWLRVLNDHLSQWPYLFGERPSLADFALFGGNAAHFINDPLCRRWADEDGPAVVAHTYRLMEPEDQRFGGWSGDVPDSMIALLADLGRLYLPWVSRATREGSAELRFAAGARVTIRSSEFLDEARATLLRRYLDYRSPALDGVLERAGILEFFAPFREYAGAIPDYIPPPQPRLNRPFPPE